MAQQMDRTDEAFVRGMIEHHQAALGMARSYLNRSNPVSRQARVADLARNIISAQTKEIEMMQSWLKESGSGSGSGGGGMKM